MICTPPEAKVFATVFHPVWIQNIFKTTLIAVSTCGANVYAGNKEIIYNWPYYPIGNFFQVLSVHGL